MYRILKKLSPKCACTGPPDKSAYWKIIFSYFSTKTYVVGTQKNRLIETVLLSPNRLIETVPLSPPKHIFKETWSATTNIFRNFLFSF